MEVNVMGNSKGFIMGQTSRLLLVDDEQRFIKSLHTILKHYNFTCSEAYTGQEAMDLLRRQTFDVALLDVGLPDISGLELVRHINGSCHQTTSIMLTGMNTVETAVLAMKHGAYDFLSKPIKHDRLVRTIDKALEHNRLQRELRFNKERFQALAQAAWEGIAIHCQGKLIEGNEQLYQMFGYGRQELVENGFLDKILSSRDLERIGPYLGRNDSKSLELTGVKSNGSTMPLEVKARSIDFNGRPAQVLVFRDISERVTAETERIELQKKLSTASKFKALGMMAGSVAHDLNNILTAVVSYPEYLLNQMEQSDQYYDEIKRIQEAGKRAAAVVSDLVSIARGGVKRPVPADLNEIILGHLDSIEHGERLAKFPDVAVQTNLQQNLKHIKCSPQHINKLLLNLVGNALEAVQQNGIVRVSTKNCTLSQEVATRDVVLRPGKYIKLTIADNGPGIDNAEKEKIFDPFFTTKKQGKSGTGLGLTIVWNIVQDHHGWIEVKNNNPGARFEIYLPASEENAETAAAMQGQSALPFLGNGESILLVDDKPEQNIIMERMLSLLNYKTHAVTSGEESLDFLKKQPVDLVLLDMIMGDGLNGRETYEQMLKLRPGQKAIIISGYSDNEEMDRARELGISTFLEKPVTLPTISKAVKRTLETLN